MIKYCDYSIVFQEIPDEVTLAVNISCCPNLCHGCHSPWLREDHGEPLTHESLHALINRYSGEITCICFMGGDGDPYNIESLSLYAKDSFPEIKTAWYSGRDTLAVNVKPASFNYIKLGA
ncbi:MAG: anaerobic ribonucleoside-triphosphate reductase activating protein, partial [Bacteroidales bacterium]